VSSRRVSLGRKCLFAWALAVALFTIAPGAKAEVPRIAIITERPDDALPALIHAELEVLGFEVVIVNPKEPEASESGGGSFAARLVPSHAGVEVWLIDSTASRLTLRELVRADGASPSSNRIAAVRAVELLRARLAAPHPEVNEAPETSVPKAESPSPAVKDATAPYIPMDRRGTFDFFLGPSVLASPGALSAGWEALLEARWMPTDHWGVGVTALFPISDAHVAAPEGSTAVSTTMAGALLDWLPLASGQRWQPHLGVALAGAFLGMTGSAEPPLFDRTEQIFVVVPSIRAGLAAKISRRLALRTDGFVGASVPRAAIRFAGREVTGWGRPLFSLSLGFEGSLL
jgi:hypothetical protein